MFEIAKDPKIWERVRSDEAFARHRKEIKEQYDRVFKIKPRAANAWEVLEFGKSREGAERGPETYRQLQTSALLSLIYPDNKEYYESLIEVIWGICNEYTWAPLGHYNSYYDRTPADFDPGLIDIFAASLAFSLAEIKSLFKDRFPKLLTDRITYEIRRHTIEPYLTRTFFWEHHNNNWTAVCTGAVGGTLMYEDPEEFMRQLPRLEKSMQCYIDSYEDDGMCVEGTAYWGFGFGFFSVYAMLLRELTNGEYDWFKLPKIKAISQFIQKMHLQPNVLAMFSDVNAREGYFVGLPHMLKTIYGDAIEKLPTEQATIVAYCHWAFAVRSTVYFNPDFVDNKLANCVYSAPVTNYFIKRTDDYGLAFKGGNQWESHNHMDVGSFILARHNRQVFCDFGYIGPGNWPGYQGDRRNEYFQPSSFSHSVPYFNGKGQGGDCPDKARAVYDEEKGTVYMDFTLGYSKKEHPNLRKAERTFTPLDDKIDIYDRYEFDGEARITERFVTTIKPIVDGNTVILDDVRFTCTSEAALNIVEQPYVDQLPDENKNYNKICYLLDYTLCEGVMEFKATIDFIN
ncbi:MAG: heparinase II/III family protein [Clostridia bacterium]|nr:heparinase II/III family protein [Clostridia bacterium]